ncbi:MAG: hypothetical protein EA376_06580 [Phycisphaeraceae bacterium]|nr:MAG: hypothetical protein EA376_06580 [Phycisphaeraceae bacterium]
MAAKAAGAFIGRRLGPINEPMAGGVEIGAVMIPRPGRAAGPDRGVSCQSPAAAARARRVTLLVLAMAMMGLTDLGLTLTYMSSVGMLEANPIARAMIEVGGARQLVIYKLFTIALSGGILYILRRHRAAEVCAWLSCAGLLLLSAHWANYNAALASASVDLGVLATDARWVHLAE